MTDRDKQTEIKKGTDTEKERELKREETEKEKVFTERKRAGKRK